MRIVSHTCSNTEILCALGMAAQLVGVDNHSDFPPQVVQGLTRVGPDLDIDIAKVQALKPDLVITSLTVPGHEKCLAQLKAAGLPVLVTEPLSLYDVASDIETIAYAVGVPKQGLQLAQQFRQRLEALQQERLNDTQAALPIAVEWWPKPVIVPGRDSWVSQMLPLVGAYNPWVDSGGKSLIIAPEDADLAAPAAVIISWCGVDESKYHPHIVHRRPGWERVPAVVNQQIYPLSEAYLGRPGPRLIEGLNRLQDIIRRLHAG